MQSVYTGKPLSGKREVRVVVLAIPAATDRLVGVERGICTADQRSGSKRAAEIQRPEIMQGAYCISQGNRGKIGLGVPTRSRYLVRWG